MARYRNFVFTLNNYTDEDRARFVKNEYINYVVYGLEVAPTTGTPHLQGYVELKQQMGIKAIHKHLFGNQKVHIEKRKGSQKQAIDYCKKINQNPPCEPNTEVFEEGNPTHQGKRSDLSHIDNMISEGVTLGQVVQQCGNFQQIRYAEKRFEYKPLSPEYIEKEVYWHYGETGTGKTRAVYEYIKHRQEEDKTFDFFRSNIGGGQWFTGYNGQQLALLDEVRAGRWPYSTMLELLDGYEVRIPTKGGFTSWNPSIVFITSPLHPKDCYKGQLEFGDGHINQLLRRITAIRKYEDNEVVLVEYGEDLIKPKETEENIPTMFLKRPRESILNDERDEYFRKWVDQHLGGQI